MRKGILTAALNFILTMWSVHGTIDHAVKKTEVILLSSNQFSVSVRNLKVSYREIQALRGIDLDFEWSLPVALLGPNGAGKTTLINVLTTMLTHYKGEAKVSGLDVRKESKKVRSLLGLMPQDNNLYEPLSGLDNLMLQGALHGMNTKESKEAAMDVLKRIGLTEVAARPVATYSGGMKRRLVYARTILHRPQIVFLDEPTTGLDVQARHALWEDIEKFQSEGRTVVLTTHYIEEAEKFCRRIVVIDHGNIIADGTAESLKSNGEKNLEEVILNITGKEHR